jgi:hypothetical protein
VADHLRAALEIYRSRFERAIAYRGWAKCLIAAQDMQRMRDEPKRLEEESTWLANVARLQQEHRRPRALQEELDSAGL